MFAFADTMLTLGIQFVGWRVMEKVTKFCKTNVFGQKL